MSEEHKFNDNLLANPGPPKSGVKKISSWLPVFVLLAVFVAGFVPMWLKSGRLAGELSRAQRQSRLDQIQITFANAALDARRGNYEPARQGMASFFTLVTAELDRGIASALAGGAPSQLQPLLDQRDDLITLLARGDPASAERLAEAYLAFRELLGAGGKALGGDARGADSLKPGIRETPK